jgi:hypothetical protein
MYVPNVGVKTLGTICSVGCATDLFQIHCDDNEVTCWFGVVFYLIAATMTLAILCMKNKTAIREKGKEIV